MPTDALTVVDRDALQRPDGERVAKIVQAGSRLARPSSQPKVPGEVDECLRQQVRTDRPPVGQDEEMVALRCEPEPGLQMALKRRTDARVQRQQPLPAILAAANQQPVGQDIVDPEIDGPPHAAGLWRQSAR